MVLNSRSYGKLLIFFPARRRRFRSLLPLAYRSTVAIMCSG